MEERSDQLSRDTPDLHSTEGGREDRGSGVQRHSEATSGPTFGGGQDGGDADYPIELGRSRGESWCFVCTTIHPDRYQSGREAWSTGILGQPKDSVPS